MITLPLILSLALCAPLQATWYVDDDADCLAADGSFQWPFCTLQDALNAASSGDRIWILPGTYAAQRSLILQKPGLTFSAVVPGTASIQVLSALADVTLEGLVGTQWVSDKAAITLSSCVVDRMRGNGTLEANHSRFREIDYWGRINLDRCLVTYELRAAPEGASWPSTIVELRHCTVKLVTHLNGGGLIYSSIVDTIANYPDWGELGAWYLGFDSCINYWWQLTPRHCIQANPRLDPVTYRPLKRSPCIDTGGEAGGVDGDLDGLAVWDMGAFEYQHPRAHGQ